MKKLKLDAICIDGGTQCRVVIDQPTVYSYVEHMKDGDEFPPLETVHDGATHWLVDGFHRWHAYKILGVKEVDVKWKPGTKDDAILEALKANARHGKTLSNQDKHNKVKMALEIPGYAEKSNYEIAKICELSQSFVASARDPKVKEQQDKNRQKHAQKKAGNTSPTSNSSDTTSPTSSEPNPHAGEGPDDEEIRAMELAHQSDIEVMHKLLESNDALKTAHDEIKRINHLNAQLELRLHGLMNERNEAVKMVKKLQKELDRTKGKK
jgi:ParB-like chromosome segregation protein Spo0J